MSDALAVRILDIVIAASALVFLGPLLIVVAGLVYIVDPGPIFFAHRRLGRDGRSFPCLKFRSMVTDADQRLKQLLATSAEARDEWARDFKLRRDPRITSIGVFLRKSSIDELPQLLNVLRGEMSIVGPRPIVEGEIERYGRYYAHYSAVKPGITGLWQVSGRNDVTYRRRVALDVTYARNKCFVLDLRILAMTVPAVLLAKGSC